MTTAHLKTGAYFGHCAKAFSCAQGVLTQVAHGSGRNLPEHGHERAYISLLVCGSYVEHIQGREFCYRPMDAVFHPFGALHSDTVGQEGATFLCLELLHEDMPIEVSPSGWWRPQRLKADMAVLMLRLYQHLRLGTLSPGIMESTLYEILGTLDHLELKHEAHFPRWLQDCLEYVDAYYQTPITVRDLAKRLDIHPVYLAREFRRRFNETLGEYVNKVRVKSACKQLVLETATLADIAIASGFYDHSHFVRVFKSSVGCAPSVFRDHAQH